jgi:hypothetical protein
MNDQRLGLPTGQWGHALLDVDNPVGVVVVEIRKHDQWLQCFGAGGVSLRGLCVESSERSAQTAGT